MGTISEDGQLEAIQLTTDLKPCVPSKHAILLSESTGELVSN